METERPIASLYARRRRLILGLQDFERSAGVCRSAIADIEEKQRALRPFVPLFRQRRGFQYLTAREFVRGYYDAVRELDGETLTADDVAIFLIRRKGLDVSNTVLRKSMRRRVVEMQRRMQRRGGAA